MRILVVGSGGREHALAWKLAQEHEVHAAPGNPGIAQVATCHPVGDVVTLACELAVDLVVVGPEDPLIDGLADRLRAAGITTFGPSAAAARLEGSKAFSKDLMNRAGVPTAHFATFTDAERAKDYVRQMTMQGRGVVVKASGAALGKGVVVCSDEDEAMLAVESMLVQGSLGAAGREIVIEERLVGYEMSILAVCSGTEFACFPPVQDYKRVFDGDQGPNTGGMGTYSPLPHVSGELATRAAEEVIRPILRTMSDDGTPFTGLLFAGILVQDGIPYCLEYNVRFGDPETQTLMVRLGDGLGETLLNAANGHPFALPEITVPAAVTVVVASPGYPGSYPKGLPITIGDLPAGVQVFHAGTALVEGQLVTNGGRVVAVSATGANLMDARTKALAAAAAVQFEGAHFRRDIGT
ncbi:MAG: phosphoribosylamine--glycine ligase [Armatimonadetes bacterium]|nr:phosphoribosylamine--glycine ligase [Armatimonadota bacterium]